MGLNLRSHFHLIMPLLLLVLTASIYLAPTHIDGENISDIPEGFTIFNEDMTYEGDLVIDGNRSVVIEDCSFDIKGRIIISDHSTLVLRNARFRLIESRGGSGEGGSEYWLSISGNARFQAINITIETIFFQSFSILVSDEAEVSFDDVYSLEWYGLVCEGNSKAQVIDSVCWSMIETRERSVLSVRDSRIYGVNVTADSTAFLEGVDTTRASVSEAGSLEIHNSTIKSDTEGLKLVFDGGTKLTLKDLPMMPGGIGYEFCESWNLYRDNDISNAHLNVTIKKVYLKSVQFVITEESDVDVLGMNNSLAGIVCRSEDLEVVESTLKEIVISGDCALRASSVELVKFQATEHSSAHIDDSKVGSVACADESAAIISSSDIDSIECHDGALLQLKNCSVPESTVVSENSILFHTAQSTSITPLDYNVIEGVLILNITTPGGEAQLEMILNRDRIRNERTIKISLNGEHPSHEISDEKDLKTISFPMPPGTWHLSISLGPPPPERVPFFLTLVGQQLISFMIILVLIIAILIAWR